ncbi:putative leucine-rich repeat receptor-like serine/threonine-protein kinase [Vitis vinifera]|uniref:Putative leucine-rich repeat receptor-like serine/threonine-protein kinase n=1 Tax=Vitis vinifera TaxID=29760 RepID=A0A438H339_VITVI|nr:putative leucine-rich repeat receptor-like serine/threonine-protein kinase [Vitis vinifera]
MDLYYLVYLSNRSLKGQDLASVLPTSLAKLPYLKTMYEVFIRNYLSGNIPHEWASMQLEFLALTVNRRMESNLFSKTVPPQLGQLVNLELLIVWLKRNSTSGLQGPIPSSISVLKDLTEL